MQNLSQNNLICHFVEFHFILISGSFQETLFMIET